MGFLRKTMTPNKQCEKGPKFPLAIRGQRANHVPLGASNWSTMGSIINTCLEEGRDCSAIAAHLATVEMGSTTLLLVPLF